MTYNVNDHQKHGENVVKISLHWLPWSLCHQRKIKYHWPCFFFQKIHQHWLWSYNHSSCKILYLGPKDEVLILYRFQFQTPDLKISRSTCNKILVGKKNKLMNLSLEVLDFACTSNRMWRWMKVSINERINPV